MYIDFISYITYILHYWKRYYSKMDKQIVRNRTTKDRRLDKDNEEVV